MQPANIARQYDFIVCGSGSSGSVVAARAAENPDVSVLLVEAGGADDAPEIVEPGLWSENLRSERDWAFAANASAYVNGRSLELNMGKVLGGGSSINVMAWLVVTRPIGTTSRRRQTTTPGAISPCSTSTAASRTGTVSTTPTTAASAGRYT